MNQQWEDATVVWEKWHVVILGAVLILWFHVGTVRKWWAKVTTEQTNEMVSKSDNREDKGNDERKWRQSRWVTCHGYFRLLINAFSPYPHPPKTRPFHFERSDSVYSSWLWNPRVPRYLLVKRTLEDDTGGGGWNWKIYETKKKPKSTLLADNTNMTNHTNTLKIYVHHIEPICILSLTSLSQFNSLIKRLWTGKHPLSGEHDVTKQETR